MKGIFHLSRGKKLQQGLCKAKLNKDNGKTEKGKVDQLPPSQHLGLSHPFKILLGRGSAYFHEACVLFGSLPQSGHCPFKVRALGRVEEQGNQTNDLFFKHIQFFSVHILEKPEKPICASSDHRDSW